MVMLMMVVMVFFQLLQPGLPLRLPVLPQPEVEIKKFLFWPRSQAPGVVGTGGAEAGWHGISTESGCVAYSSCLVSPSIIQPKVL